MRISHSFSEPFLPCSGFDWQNLSPDEFLEFLKTVEKPCFVVCGLHCGWITESDRAEIAQLTGS